MLSLSAEFIHVQVLEGLQTIGRMAYVHDISRYGVPIFHAIVNILQNVSDPHLKEAALNVRFLRTETAHPYPR